VSAQIITALRRRASQLDAEAQSMEAAGIGETPDPGGRSIRELRFLAVEFQALADAAESR